MCKIGCNLRCFLTAIIASLLIGVVGAVLRFTAVINVTPAFLWVLFGIGIALLAVLFLTAAFAGSGRVRACLCADTGYLLTGILGTVLTSVILLGVPFVATSVLGTVITGALLFFFAFTVATLACTVKCLTDCDCCDD
ncbi:MAG: hypothetical protein E7660_06120 [Ruminococcaceae bacterium]|nr:hypothetical protein [Oscillospiraceae bacterium]